MMDENRSRVPLKAFGNWRAKFKAEPQPLERKLLYRRSELGRVLIKAAGSAMSERQVCSVAQMGYLPGGATRCQFEKSAGIGWPRMETRQGASVSDVSICLPCASPIYGVDLGSCLLYTSPS